MAEINTNLDTTPLPPNNLVAKDPQSAELAGYVRTKTFGRDVRESIARSIELNSTRSKSAEILANKTLQVTETATSNMANQVELIRAEKDAVIANATVDSEVILARGGKVTLGQRLDETDTQLAQTGKALGTTNIGENIKRPAITIITDDGYNGDVDYMLPISQRTGVPFSTAIITSKITDTDTGHIGKDEILMLQNDYGWEILSHGVDHLDLSTLSRSQQEYQLSKSKQDLLDIGVNIKNMVYPYGAYNKDTLELTRKYYRGGRSTDFGLFGGINSSPIDTYALNVIWMDSNAKNPSDPSGLTINTPEYYQHYIDLAVEKKAWLIILLHSNDTQVAGLGPLLEETINYGKSNGADFLTIDQGLDRFGNAVDVGESVEQQPDFSEHFLVGHDGQIRFKGLPTIFEGTNAFDGNSLFSDFKDFSTTVNRVTTAIATDSGLPDSVGGLLVTMKTSDRNKSTQYDFDTQFYITIFNNTYIRGRTSSNGFTKWKSVSGYSVDRTVTFSDNMDSFAEGMTYSSISHANATDSPTGQGGLLITNIFSNEHGFNYQTFRAFDSDSEFTRNFNADGTPKSWVKKTQYTTVSTPWVELPSKKFTKLEISSSKISEGDFVTLNPTEPFLDDFIFTSHVKNGKIILNVYNPRDIPIGIDAMNWKVKIN